MKKISLYALAAGCLLAIAVLVSVFVRTGNQEAVKVLSTQPVSCDGGLLGLRLPKTLPEIMKLSKVEREEVRVIEQWDGYTATRKFVHFPGLVLGIVTFSNDADRYMVGFAEIADAKWSRITPFKVGESVASVRRKLGPLADNDADLTASYGDNGNDIRFQSYRGKITKITYVCYTG